jgi:hypothetical protein
MPMGRGEAGEKKHKRKSKAQLEKELKKGPPAPPPPMTFEVIKPKRKVRE